MICLYAHIVNTWRRGGSCMCPRIRIEVLFTRQRRVRLQTAARWPMSSGFQSTRPRGARRSDFYLNMLQQQPVSDPRTVFERVRHRLPGSMTSCIVLYFNMIKLREPTGSIVSASRSRLEKYWSFKIRHILDSVMLDLVSVVRSQEVESQAVLIVLHLVQKPTP